MPLCTYSESFLWHLQAARHWPEGCSRHNMPLASSNPKGCEAWALNNSEVGAAPSGACHTLGPATFASVGARVQTVGAFANRHFLYGALIGVYRGVPTICDTPPSQTHLHGADPRYVLHMRRNRSGLHVYFDATDPARSSWCRYINTHIGTYSAIPPK
jgi:hypothetical protein